MADSRNDGLHVLVKPAYSNHAGTVNESGRKEEKTMTPAAFLQTELSRDIAVATRREEGALRVSRSPRRVSAFVTSDAQTPLFHAWRP